MTLLKFIKEDLPLLTEAEILAKLEVGDVICATEDEPLFYSHHDSTGDLVTSPIAEVLLRTGNTLVYKYYNIVVLLRLESKITLQAESYECDRGYSGNLYDGELEEIIESLEGLYDKV